MTDTYIYPVAHEGHEIDSLEHYQEMIVFLANATLELSEDYPDK